MFLKTRRILSIVLILIFSIVTFSCEKEEVVTTGNIKVQIQTSSDLNGVTYSVYSEVYLTAVDEYVPPVTTGTISGGQILIRGLNAGNYILELNAGHNLRYFIQATAGQERTFSISI